MSNETTKRMITAYNQDAAPTMFLSGLFEARPENFHDSEEVEIDIQRSGEKIAIVISDPSTGYRMNESNIYTNKGFKPPIFQEAVALNAFELLKRDWGQNPFASNAFRATLIKRLFRGMSLVEDKIRRTVELQASQILQTGIVTLINSAGVALYTLSFQPKATHFPTAGTAWDAVGADPLGDLKALSEVVRNDGKRNPDQLLMGCDAFTTFLANEDVQAAYDNRRIDQGTISPMKMRSDGGIFRGVVEVGNYKFDIWTYGGRYEHPQTSTITQFIDPAKVVVRSSTGRMDATFGAVPNFNVLLGQGNLVPELPGRMTAGGDLDLSPNIWKSVDGSNLFGGVASRPLLIPVAIDTFGCLDTGL